MYVKIFAKKDNSILQYYPNYNFGRDAFIGIHSQYYRNDNNDVTTEKQVSRALIQFDIEKYRDLILSNSASLTANLVLFDNSFYREHKNAEPFIINIFPISQSWNEGVGHEATDADIPSAFVQKIGVQQASSWNYRDKNYNTWENNISGSTTSSTGGSWYYDMGISAQVYGFENTVVNVKDIVLKWANGEIDNNGFIIKLHDDYEASYTVFSTTGTPTGSTTITVVESVKDSTPSQGKIRIYDNTRSVYDTYSYTAWSNSTFYLTSPTTEEYFIEDTIEVEPNALTNVQYFKSYFSRHTHTIYHPFIEIIYDDNVCDDRGKFIKGIPQNVYFYNFFNERLVDLDGENGFPGTVSICGSTGNSIFTGLVPYRVKQGIYGVTFTYTGNELEITDNWQVSSTSSATAYLPSTAQFDINVVNSYGRDSYYEKETEIHRISIDNIQEYYLQGSIVMLKVNFFNKSFGTRTLTAYSGGLVPSLDIKKDAYIMIVEYSTGYVALPLTKLSYDRRGNYVIINTDIFPINKRYIPIILYYDNGVLKKKVLTEQSFQVK